MVTLVNFLLHLLHASGEAIHTHLIVMHLIPVFEPSITEPIDVCFQDNATCAIVSHTTPQTANGTLIPTYYQ